MRSVRKALLVALRDLKELNAKFALVGGLAVSARTEARMTRDVDFAVKVGNDSEAEEVVFQMQASGYTVIATVENTATNRLATARLRPKTARDEGALVDLLFASSGIEPEVVDDAEQATFLRGIGGPLATKAHLIAMKILSRNDRQRPNDAADLRALLLTASESDVAQARVALALIMNRGFARDRDLLALLDQTIHEFLDA
jgi:hypothetical protein